MFILSILLFWLPLIGPLVAGFVGGRKAGTLAGIHPVILGSGSEQSVFPWIAHHHFRYMWLEQVV